MARAAIATGNPLTIADLEAMPDDGRRYELIGGAIVMTAAPVPLHQVVLFRLQLLLQGAVGEDYFPFGAPVDLDLPGEQRVEPDLVVAPWSSAGEKRLHLPVMLVVEIVSLGSRTHDLVTKRGVYAEAGIPAYWLVDLLAEEITALRLTPGGRYEPYARGASITVDWPVSLTIDLAALSRRAAARGGE